MGSEDGEELRTKWHGLKLRHQGALRLTDWRSFAAEFFRLKALVGGTEEEGKAILMRILPIEFRKKILQEEDRRTQNDLVIHGLGDLTPSEISQFIHTETGITPQSVAKRGDKVVVGIIDGGDKEKLFQM